MSYLQIIPAELFNRVQARLSANKRKNKRSSKKTYMLMRPVVDNFEDNTYELLLDRFERAKGDREKQIR